MFVATILKYVGLIVALASTIISSVAETKDDRSHQLTSAGVFYLCLGIAGGVVAMSAAYLDDRKAKSDSKRIGLNLGVETALIEFAVRPISGGEKDWKETLESNLFLTILFYRDLGMKTEEKVAMYFVRASRGSPLHLQESGSPTNSYHRFVIDHRAELKSSSDDVTYLPDLDGCAAELVVGYGEAGFWLKCEFVFHKIFLTHQSGKTLEIGPLRRATARYADPQFDGPVRYMQEANDSKKRRNHQYAGPQPFDALLIPDEDSPTQ